MDYYLMGYLFIIFERRSDWLPEPLPIIPCPQAFRVIPDADCFSWMSDDEGHAALAGELGHDGRRFDDFTAWCDAGFGDTLDHAVIYDRAPALEMANRFLRDVANLRLLAIYIAEPFIEGFLTNSVNANPGYHFERVVRRRVPESHRPDETTLGYDMLRCIDGMGLDSPNCFGWAATMTGPLAGPRNAIGLLVSDSDWRSAAAFVGDNDIDHPADWFFCKIKEVDLAITGGIGSESG